MKKLLATAGIVGLLLLSAKEVNSLPIGPNGMKSVTQGQELLNKTDVRKEGEVTITTGYKLADNFACLGDVTPFTHYSVTALPGETYRTIVGYFQEVGVPEEALMEFRERVWETHGSLDSVILEPTGFGLLEGNNCPEPPLPWLPKYLVSKVKSASSTRKGTTIELEDNRKVFFPDERMRFSSGEMIRLYDQDGFAKIGDINVSSINSVELLNPDGKVTFTYYP